LHNPGIAGALLDLVGLPPEKIHLAFIPTASNVEEGDKSWLIGDYENVKKQGFACIDIVDISALPQDLWLRRIEAANVIMVGGGNTHYLMAWLKSSGLAGLLPDLLKTRVYVGSSAGSIVTTLSLRTSSSQRSHAEKIFPLKDDRGLGFVNFLVSPHFNADYYHPGGLAYIRTVSKDLSAPVYALDDDSAILVDGGEMKVISEGVWELIRE
jgi:dipeptidase E